MDIERKRLLVFIDWYYPAYKAGGPIQSVKNLVQQLDTTFDIYLLTSDTDFDSTDVLKITKNKWVKGINNENVFYSTKSYYSFSNLKKLVLDVNPTTIYINSMFSLKYAIVPLIVSRRLKTEPKIVLAPRGMLQEGALQFKKTKKKLLLFCLRFVGITKKINFQATDNQEAIDIKKNIINYSSISIVKNFAAKPLTSVVSITKNVGELKIIYLARIVEKKNLLYLLRLLAEINSNKIELNIYGDIGDNKYWQNCEAEIKKLHELGLTIVYHGPINNNEVAKAMQQNHLYILPTHGENFGHSIYEALSNSRPVIISDKTPWQNLEQTKSGFSVPLASVDVFKQKILFFKNLNQEEFNVWSQGALEISIAYNKQNNLTEQYEKLFNH